MDRHGRPTIADIPDATALRAVMAYQRDTRADKPWPYQREGMELWPEKLALAKLAHPADRGLVEYGVSLRTGWLTPLGEAALASLCVQPSC